MAEGIVTSVHTSMIIKIIKMVSMMIKPGEHDNKPGEHDNKPGEHDNKPGEHDNGGRPLFPNHPPEISQRLGEWALWKVKLYYLN